MSNKCPKCGNSLMLILARNKNPITDILQCDICRLTGERRIFDNTILFDRITASPEMLAPKFIGLIFDHRFTSKYRYYSMLTGEFYNSESEAIAATVARLKEVKDE